jgi:hypothetical protein
MTAPLPPVAAPSLLTTLLILLVGVGFARISAGRLARWAVPAIVLELAVGFVLGAVVSPPDAVAPMAIARRFGQDLTILAPGDEDGTVTIDASARIRTIASPRFPLDRKYWYFGDEPQLHAALDALGTEVKQFGAVSPHLQRWQHTAAGVRPLALAVVPPSRAPRSRGRAPERRLHTLHHSTRTA